jgi:hypothetical protein
MIDFQSFAEGLSAAEYDNVPFFSSIVTVSLAHFMRNLRSEHERLAFIEPLLVWRLALSM